MTMDVQEIGMLLRTAFVDAGYACKCSSLKYANGADMLRCFKLSYSIWWPASCMI